MKDTAANILETGEFVVNVMSEWFVEAANHTCGQFASDADEMAEANLSPAASLRRPPPPASRPSSSSATAPRTRCATATAS